MTVTGSAGPVAVASPKGLRASTGLGSAVEISLSGKVALVTGAGPNIGSGIALALSRYGARVACNDLDPAAAKAAVRRIERNGGTGLALAGDVSVEADVVANIGAVLQAWDRIDIVINNAAWLHACGLLEEDLASFNRAITIAVNGNFLYTKHGALAMIERGIRGSIVSILSSNAWQGAPGFIAYATHKGGLANFVRAAAMDLAPVRHPGQQLHPDRAAAGQPGTAGPVAGLGADGTAACGPGRWGAPAVVAAGRDVRRARADPDGRAGHPHRHRPLHRLAVVGLRAPDHRVRLRDRRRRPGQVLGLYPGGGGRGGAGAVDPAGRYGVL
jgi:NAD(P)-dependent dehydrogenase (short-subunit alcohol dehydrogenase family)